MVSSVVRNTTRGIVRDARLREVVLYYSINLWILQEGWRLFWSLILARICWYIRRSQRSDCGAVSKEYAGKELRETMKCTGRMN